MLCAACSMLHEFQSQGNASPWVRSYAGDITLILKHGHEFSFCSWATLCCLQSSRYCLWDSRESLRAPGAPTMWTAVLEPSVPRSVRLRCLNVLRKLYVPGWRSTRQEVWWPEVLSSILMPMIELMWVATVDAVTQTSCDLFLTMAQ